MWLFNHFNFRSMLERIQKSWNRRKCYSVHVVNRNLLMLWNMDIIQNNTMHSLQKKNIILVKQNVLGTEKCHSYQTFNGPLAITHIKSKYGMLPRNYIVKNRVTTFSWSPYGDLNKNFGKTLANSIQGNQTMKEERLKLTSGALQSKFMHAYPSSLEPILCRTATVWFEVISVIHCKEKFENSNSH